MEIIYDKALKEKVDERFSFMDIIPSAMSVIDIESGVLVKCNSIMASVLRINKNKCYNVKDLVKATDISFDKILSDYDFIKPILVVAKSSKGKLVTLSTSLSEFEIDNKRFFLCSHKDILKNISSEKYKIDDSFTDNESDINTIKKVFENLPLFACVFSSTKKEILFSNSTFKSIFGEGSSTKKIDEIFSNVDELSARKKMDKAPNTFEFEIIIGSKWFKISSTDIHWDKTDHAVLLLGADITKTKRLEDKILFMATTDSMTNILNRQAGIDYVNDYIKSVNKEKIPFTVSYIDVNSLKKVNDTYGFIEGDNYIMSVVNIIRGAIRQTDIFCRMGGDEFLIIFPKCAYDVVNNIMGTIVNKLEAYSTTEMDYTCSIAYGILEVNTESELNLNSVLGKVEEKMSIMKDEFKQNTK